MSQRRRVLDPDRAASDPARRSTGEPRGRCLDGPYERSPGLVGATHPQAATGASRDPHRSARPPPPASGAGCRRGNGRFRRPPVPAARSATLRPRRASAPAPLRSSPPPRPRLRAGARGATPVPVGVVRSDLGGDVVASLDRSVRIPGGGPTSGPGRSPSRHLRGRPIHRERPSARGSRAVGSRRRPFVLSAGSSSASKRIRRLGRARDRALAGSVPPTRRLSGRRQAPVLPAPARRPDPGSRRGSAVPRRGLARAPRTDPPLGDRPVRVGSSALRTPSPKPSACEQSTAAGGDRTGRAGPLPQGSHRRRRPDRWSLSHPPVSGRRRVPWPGRSANPLVARRRDSRAPWNTAPHAGDPRCGHSVVWLSHRLAKSITRVQIPVPASPRGARIRRSPPSAEPPHVPRTPLANRGIDLTRSL